MVETRSSPSRVSTRQNNNKRKMPALPTNNAKKKKMKNSNNNNSKKVTSKQVAAAKKKAAAAEAMKSQPVAVKDEVLMTGKRRMWTEEEDIAACKAYVNVTCDPIAGAQQKGDDFWMRVQKKMYELYEAEAEVADVKDEWGYKSVEYRISKTIGKQTQKFNQYFKATSKQDESGWTLEMHIAAAAELYLETEGRPFKFPVCARILHQCPKFKPATESPKEDEEDEDGKPAAIANPVASIQGKGLPIPMGTKKAKKTRLELKMEAESVATAAHTDAVLAVARSAAQLNKTFDKKRRIDSMHKSVDAYLRLGDTDKARELLQRIDQLNAEEEEEKPPASTALATPTASSLPTSINIGSEDDEEEEEEEEEDIQPTQMRFTSLPGALDSGDSANKSDEESSHPSQPSDDSRLIKNSSLKPTQV